MTKQTKDRSSGQSAVLKWTFIYSIHDNTTSR